MRKTSVLKELDWFTLIMVLVMMFFGWMNIYSVEYPGDDSSVFDFSRRYGRQLIWILTSVVIASVLLLIDYRFYDFFAFFIYGFAILLLLAVLLLGKEINGAKSWFEFGSIRIQPSELAKPAVALALAKYLSVGQINIRSFRSLLIAGGIFMFPVLLIMLQPDTGSALVFFSFILAIYREGFSTMVLLAGFALVLIFLMVLLLPFHFVLAFILISAIIAWGVQMKSIKQAFIATAVSTLSFLFLFLLRILFDLTVEDYILVSISALFTGLVFGMYALWKRFRKPLVYIAVVLLAAAYSFSVDYAFTNLLSDYQQRRVNVLLGFESDPHGAGYNVNQSKIAIGSGGMTGKGFLNGTQTKLNFVPEQSTDFIFCTVGEEWGFVGSALVVLLFMFFLLRLLFLAERQKNRFARVFGYGVLSVFFFHFFVNIAMTIGLFPVIGIPLPFYSYGGSSLWSFTLMLFIFLRLDAGRRDFIR